MPNLLKQSLKFLIPVILIIGTFFLVLYLISNQPATNAKRNKSAPPLNVSVLDITTQSFQINIDSYGTVSPRTQSFLVSQVSGQIIEISHHLREGGFFKKGSVLLRIDDRDYLADVQISKANLADAQQALSEELALSLQAENDWKKLGYTSSPSDLVLRKPQQEAAKAQLASAQAALSKAQLTLDRTKVIAPYDGRVLSKLVDVGQVANTNTQIAEIYATDYIEIRLPLKTADLKFIDLPETYQTLHNKKSNALVEVFSSLTDAPIAWNGEIVRTESAIDNDSRQLHVVAQVDDPFNTNIPERAPLKIGEYVTTRIAGKKIGDAIIIPAKSIYQNSYVYVVDDDIIKRQSVEPLWQDGSEALIGSGLSEGDRLVTTTLGQIPSGTRVQIEGEETTIEEKSETRSRTKSESNTKRDSEKKRDTDLKRDTQTKPEAETNTNTRAKR